MHRVRFHLYKVQIIDYGSMCREQNYKEKQENVYEKILKSSRLSGAGAGREGLCLGRGPCVVCCQWFITKVGGDLGLLYF